MKIIFSFSLFLISISSFSQYDEVGKLKSEIIKKKELNYLLHIPKNTNQMKPLLVFLHGTGEKGNDLEKVKNIGPFKYIKNNDLDAYVLGPQCPENEYWDSEVLYQLILKIQKENNIDTNRIYLTGLSMGAWATWNLVYAYPKLFAAIVPIAGYVDRIPMVENCKIANIPIRVFHGLLDDTVNINYSIEIYKKLKVCNTDIELTIFDDAYHDSWSRVYDNKKIYDWMFEQLKKP